MTTPRVMTISEYKAALAKSPRKVAGRVNNHTELVKAVIARLNLIPGVDAIPMNTGEIHREGVHVKYGFPGMADIYCRVAPRIRPCICPSKTLWLEVKTGEGRPSKVQLAFKEMVERWGDRYAITRSIDDAEKAVVEINT